MSDAPDDLEPSTVQALLSTARIGRSLQVLAQTDSTNDDATTAAASGCADGHVIVADSQRAGRGSRGRSWVSPAGTDLYVSIVVRLDLPPAQLPPLTLAVGLAVADAVDGALGQPAARVKWPNDVWLQDHKCGGILVESSSAAGKAAPLVVGIGLNVNRRSWPAGLDTPPTSLALQAGDDCDRAQVLAAMLNHLEQWLDRFVADGAAPIAQALNLRLALKGKQVQCDSVQGELVGVAASGALQIRTAAGVQEVVSGTLRPA